MSQQQWLRKEEREALSRIEGPTRRGAMRKEVWRVHREVDRPVATVGNFDHPQDECPQLWNLDDGRSNKIQNGKRPNTARHRALITIGLRPPPADFNMGRNAYNSVPLRPLSAPLSELPDAMIIRAKPR